MSTPSVDLPEEVIELILSKSPFQSVARFKPVSKSWQSIISTPRFSRIHRAQQPEIPNRFLIWTPWEVIRRCKYYVIIRLEEKKFLTESALDNPFEAKPGKPAIGYRYITLDYSNGLFLLGTYDLGNYDYVLWNPSMRKHITIRALSRETHPHAFRTCPHSLSDDPILCHLYHDPATDDHKIVLLYDRRCYSVYSCNNGSWSEMKDFTCDLSLIGKDSEGFADGRYCILYNGEIECFDFRDGKSHKLRPPLAVNSRTKLWEVSGRLCFFETSEDCRGFQMWVVEKKNGSFEDCWRKVVSMKTADELWFVQPLFFSNEDNVLLKLKMKWKYPKHVMYNSCEHSLQNVEFDWKYPYQIFPYLENLYMPRSNILE